MRTLSPFRRDRLRALGVEASLPRLLVFHRPGDALHHLSPECGGVPVELTALDLDVAHACGACGVDRSHLVAAARDLLLLDEMVELLELQELTCSLNSLERSPHAISPRALLGVIRECVHFEQHRLRSLSESEFVGGVVPVLLQRSRAARSLAVSMLRHGRGRAALDADLLRERMLLQRDGNALLVETGGLSPELAALAFVYGDEVVPGRILIQDAREAIGFVSYRSRSLVFDAAGVPEEVLRTAAALWDPAGSGPLSSGAELLVAAANLTSSPA